MIVPPTGSIGPREVTVVGVDVPVAGLLVLRLRLRSRRAPITEPLVDGPVGEEDASSFPCE